MVNARVLSRLKRLEAQTGSQETCVIRLGVLKRLSEEYIGERHVVERGQSSSPDCGYCELEERPGPTPPGSDDGVTWVFVSEDEMRI
jgi:hypothetical protein